MFDKKYFRIIDNEGDGFCLLYSISDSIKNHKNSFSPNTDTQEYWNSMSNITSRDTMIESNILEYMATILGDLRDDVFTTLVDYLGLDKGQV